MVREIWTRFNINKTTQKQIYEKKNNNKNKNLKSSQTHHQKETNYTKKVIRNTKWARTHDQLCTIKHINNQNLWNPEAESYKNWRKQQGSEKEKKKKNRWWGVWGAHPRHWILLSQASWMTCSWLNLAIGVVGIRSKWEGF